MVQMKDWNFEDVKISPNSSFAGFLVLFSVKEHRYQFLVGGFKKPFPLNVVHIFKEQDTCAFCGKTIYAYPAGQQICLGFQRDLHALLQYFLETYPDSFVQP